MLLRITKIIKKERIKWTDKWKAWKNGRIIQNYYEKFQGKI